MRQTPDCNPLQNLPTKEHRRVYRQIPSDAHTPQRRERAERDIAVRTSRSSCKNADDKQRKVERPAAAPDVRADAPEGSADEEADVLRELEERAFETEFLHHRREDEAGDNLREL